MENEHRRRHLPRRVVVVVKTFPRRTDLLSERKKERKVGL
jgi:hypothetical protein